MTDELRTLAEALIDPKWERGNPLPSKDTADRFRAAASPAAVLALLDERDEARAAVRRLSGALETALLDAARCRNPQSYRDNARHVVRIARDALADPVVRRIVEVE
jgi:hypothetical protein